MVLSSLTGFRRLTAALIATLSLGVAALAGASEADAAFVYGSQFNQYGTNCISHANEVQVASFAAYTSGSKVGERWYVRIEMAEIGNPCAGEVVSPSVASIGHAGSTSSTVYAIDSTHPVKCELNSDVSNANGWFDATDNPGLSDGHGGHYTPCHHDSATGAYAVLSRGQGFRLTFPVVSKAPLGGISTSDKLQGQVDTALAASPGTPWVWVNVADNPPTIAYGSPSASSVTTATAHTAATLANHYHAGTASFDIGTTTAYGRTESVAITSQNDSELPYDDWDALAPDTVYHWRLRFAGADGHTYYGADQSFRTAAAPGAPDRDGDGIADASDACPDQSAPGTANGCPAPPPVVDRDGDGVPDSRDACPTQAAPGTADGCPVTHPPVGPPVAQPVCRVPKLTNLSLAKAKRALAKAGCGLGRVSPKHPGRGWVVHRQGVRAGLRLKRGTKISLTLARPRRHH